MLNHQLILIYPFLFIVFFKYIRFILMSDYKYSIEAKNVNKIFIKINKAIKALINFDIKIKKGAFMVC